MKCRIYLSVEYETSKYLAQRKRYDSKTKKSLIKHILMLLDRDYNHFFVFIENTSDMWLAELLYFLSFCPEYAFKYSIGLWSDDNAEPKHNFLDNERFLVEILSRCTKVYILRPDWFSPYFNIHVEFINI